MFVGLLNSLYRMYIITRKKTSIRYAREKDKDREKREKREKEREIEREGERERERERYFDDGNTQLL